MKDPEIVSGIVPLTETVVRKCLSVTPALRRELLRCFPGLTLEEAKDDDVFYPYLTDLLNNDMEAVLRYDKEVRRRDKQEKAFLFRSIRRVRTDFPMPVPTEEYVACLVHLIADESLSDEQRQLASFSLRFAAPERFADPDDHGLGGPPTETAQPVPEPAVVWQETINRLRQLLELADAPDPGLADRVVSLGGTLADLAHRHAEEVGAQAVIAELSQSLRRRIEDSFTADELEAAGDWSLPQDRETLEELATCLDAIEAATQEMARADRDAQAAKEAARSAYDEDRDDFPVLDRAYKDLRAEVETIRSQRSASVQAATRHLVAPPAVDIQPVRQAAMAKADKVDEPAEETLSPATEDLPPEPEIPAAEVGAALTADDDADTGAGSSSTQLAAAGDRDAPSPDIAREAAMSQGEDAAQADLAETTGTDDVQPGAAPGSDSAWIAPREGAASPPDIEGPSPQATLSAEGPPGQAIASVPAAEPDPELSDEDGQGWTGGKDIGGLLEDYLRQQETVFAAQLAELAEKRGVEVPVPAAILRALHESRLALQPDEIVHPRLTGALDSAVSALTELGTHPDTEPGLLADSRRLVFSALLRPALFGTYREARLYLKDLDLDGPERPLASLLGGLGYEVHLSLHELRALKEQAGPSQLPAQRRAMAEFLNRNRQTKKSYQPASRLLHQLFEPNGELGRIFELALKERPEALQEITALLEDFPTGTSELRAYVEERDQALNPVRNNSIEGSALRALCSTIEAAGDALRNWADIARAEITPQDDRRREMLLSRVGQVKKEAELLRRTLSEGGTGGLSDAVRLVVIGAAQDLITLCDGGQVALPAPRTGSRFDGDLLRLRGGAQPRAEEEASFALERQDQEEALFAALHRPGDHSPDLAAAFHARLREHATLAAHDILQLAERRPELVPGLDLQAASAELDEEIRQQRSNFLRRLETLASRLAAIVHLAGDDREQVADALQKLAIIGAALRENLARDTETALIPARNGLRSAEVPPDFPELERVLARMESLIGNRTSKIREDQRRRLEKLSEREACRQSALELIEHMDQLDLVTVDSMIGQIQDGLPLEVGATRRTDIFDMFHPGFVQAMAQNAGPSIKLVDDALSGARIGGLSGAGLTEDQMKLAHEIMRLWGNLTKAMKGGNTEQLRSLLLNLLGTLGFVETRLDAGTALIRTKLHRFELQGRIDIGEDHFLPPIYGSLAQNRYHVLIADDQRPDSELSTQLGNLGRDRPCFLFVLGRLDRRRRENLAQLLRLERQTAVLVDETLMAFLALTEGNPLAKLFSCGLPYGWVQPYTTNPRSIPREMFFGRKDEIQRIIDRENGGCLVYGGRQLGKSALLSHVCGREHSPNGPKRAIYLDIKPIGGRGVPSDRLWSELQVELKERDVFGMKEPTAKSFRDEVTRWIAGAPGRRLLVMLDEADNFLAAEARNGFANLRVLKDLMEATHWSFKVVFAGLHNVRRMSRAPNSPLPHLGEPICVGPLDGKAGSQASRAANLAEARRLVTAPMRAAGFEYEDPNLAFTILARVNYYPSLVQVFCKKVVESAGKVRRPAGTGPYWKLGWSDLFEGAIGQEINKEIQNRFQLTVQLDWRYEAIAKTIALRGLDDPEGNTEILRTGLVSETIFGLVSGFWPKEIPLITIEDFRILLDEMTDLGLLSQPSEDRYVLRNAQVAQLLGPRDELETAVLTAMQAEEQVDYDAATFHSPLATNDPDDCAPISDRQLDELLDRDANRGKVGVLVVAPRLWTSRLTEGLRKLIGTRVEDDRALLVEVVTGGTQAIRKHVDAHRDRNSGRLILLIDSDWDDAAALTLAGIPQVRDGSVRPIWIVPPAWQVASHRKGERPAGHLSVQVARPWTSAMLRHWLDSHGLARFDQRQIRQAILEVTGGLPIRLRALLPFLQQQNAGPDAQVLQAIRSWAPPSDKADLRPGLSDFGFAPQEAEALRTLAEELMTSGTGEVELQHVDQMGVPYLSHSAGSLGLVELRNGKVALTPLGHLLAS